MTREYLDENARECILLWVSLYVLYVITNFLVLSGVSSLSHKRKATAN